jgi:hypothetical protein
MGIFYTNPQTSCAASNVQIEVYTTMDEDYMMVVDSLLDFLSDDKESFLSICSGLISPGFIKKNLYDLVLVTDKKDQNNLLGIASYTINDDYTMTIHLLCTHSKCGRLIMGTLMHIAEEERTDKIIVPAIFDAIGFYWRMGFGFYPENLSCFDNRNEIGKDEKQYVIDNNVKNYILSKELSEELKKAGLQYDEDTYIMTLCIWDDDDDFW